MIKFSALLFIGAWASTSANIPATTNDVDLNDFTYYVLDRHYNKTVSKVLDILNIPQIPERYFTGNEKFFKNANRKPVLGFSWNNCGSSSDPVQLKSLSLSDPLHLPGSVTIGFDLVTSVPITSPLELQLTIKKKVVFFWIEVPCIDEAGSCTYSDICNYLPSQCPAEFIEYNIPCHCPADQGEYIFPEGQINLPSLPLPSWLTRGDYWIEAVGLQNGNRLFCYDLTVSIA